MAAGLRSSGIINRNKPCLQQLRIWQKSYHPSSPAQASTSSKYPFPSRPNPTPWDIFHLPKDASQSDIKARYFELVRLYHPDVCQAHGLEPALAESRFQAVTNAYNSLRLGTGSTDGTGDSSGKSEADEIREKFAAWRARERSSSNAYDWQRRQRALYAEANATKWWQTDGIILWLFAGITVGVGIMHFTTRSPERRTEDARRYLEMRNKYIKERQNQYMGQKSDAGSNEHNSD